MKIIYNQIDDLMTEINNEINNLTYTKETVKTDLSNYQSKQKELQLQIEDLNKIISSYSGGNNTHAVFSPIENDNPRDELLEYKYSELESIKYEYENVSEKVVSKQLELDNLMNSAEKMVDLLVSLETIKKSIKTQVDTSNNERYVKELKDIQQKKRMIHLEQRRLSPVVSKMDNLYITPSKNSLAQIKLALSFIQTEPLRAKQVLEKTYDDLSKTISNSEQYLKKLVTVEKIPTLSSSLKDYIGDIVQIYPQIKFRMVASNLNPVDNLDGDLNHCLMGLFRGLINSFILKTNPKEIQLKVSYLDGYLNVNGAVIGNYFNFYNEMKESPTSIVANLYEKVFLLHGDMIFKNNHNGTFNVNISIPIKNYLV